MKSLCECLALYMEKKNTSASFLAARTGIDRATIYQYINGTRPLVNENHLNTIMHELHLSPSERTNLLKAYNMERVGPQTYNRRLKFEELLRSLQDFPMVPLPTALSQDAAALPAEALPVMAEGELKINAVLHQIFLDAARRDADLALLTQPDGRAALDALLLLWPQTKHARITHLICWEADSNQSSEINLAYAKQVIRYSVGLVRYDPFYFYGAADEHYGSMNLLPYLIFSDRYAVQLSANWQTALIYTDEQIVQYFSKAFRHMQDRSRPLLTRMEGIAGRAQWGMDYLTEADFTGILSMHPNLTAYQFWDEEIIRTYLSEAIPNREEMIAAYTQITSYMNRLHKMYGIHDIVNAAVVEDFIRNGIFKEFPPILADRPLSKADRRRLMERMIAGIQEGWYHFQMLPPEVYVANIHWEIGCQQNSHLLLQHSTQTGFHIYRFEEPDIVHTAYDYLQSLVNHPNTLNEIQAIPLIRQWMNQYLSEDESAAGQR